MNAQEFLVNMLDVLGVKEVYHLRAKQVDTDTGLDMPSVIWRSASKRRADSMDGPSGASTEVFEIECRDTIAFRRPEYVWKNKVTGDETHTEPPGWREDRNWERITVPPPPDEFDKSAQGLAERLLWLLSPRLVSVLADYDEPDDPSQEVSGYYSHILRVEINNVS